MDSLIFNVSFVNFQSTGIQMNNEDIKNQQNIMTDKETLKDSAQFISSEEDEKEGNFEFLCCRGGAIGVGGGGIGGHW